MKLYFTKWYLPIIVACILSFIAVLSLPIINEIVFNAILYLPLSAWLVSGILGIIKVFKKQFANGLWQVSITLILGFCWIFILGICMYYYPYDFFATNLKIPQNIALNVPADSITPVIHKNHDFEIYAGFQPGIYSYAAWLQNTAKGTLYLKAYEVTQGTPLSTDRLLTRSAINVENTNALKMYSLKEENFMIEEGDWGDPYAARFELWLKPDDKKPEIKLAEKIYKIEGWTR